MGQIDGRVVQGTVDGTPVNGLIVSLESYRGTAAGAVLTVTVDAEGAFAFANLPVDAELTYLATTTHHGVLYSSNPVQLTTETRQGRADITIYDTTTDPAAIRMARTDWIVDPQAGALTMGQIVTFSNQGDRTYVGDDDGGSVRRPVTVGIHVPADALQVDLEGGTVGDRFRRRGDTIYDTRPVPPGPGTRRIIARYLLPSSGDQRTFTHEFLYPADQAGLFLVDRPGLEIESEMLTESGRQTVGGVQYRVWQATEPLPERLEISVTGLLAQEAPAQPQSAAGNAVAPDEEIPWLLLLVGAAALAGAILAVTILARRTVTADPGAIRNYDSGEPSQPSHAPDPDRELDALIDAIAALDDQHAAGALDREEWQRQRARLKSTLLLAAHDSPGGDSLRQDT